MAAATKAFQDRAAHRKKAKGCKKHCLGNFASYGIFVDISVRVYTVTKLNV